jgi:hypothetical protein
MQRFPQNHESSDQRILTASGGTVAPTAHTRPDLRTIRGSVHPRPRRAWGWDSCRGRPPGQAPDLGWDVGAVTGVCSLPSTSEDDRCARSTRLCNWSRRMRPKLAERREPRPCWRRRAAADSARDLRRASWGYAAALRAAPEHEGVSEPAAASPRSWHASPPRKAQGEHHVRGAQRCRHRPGLCDQSRSERLRGQ